MPLRKLLSGHLLLVPAFPRSLAADTRSALPGSQLPATAPASCAGTNRPLPLRRLSRCRGLRCNSCLQSPSASGSHATAPSPPAAGRRLKARQVRTRVGLRKSLAPGDGTVQDARDELFFLLIGAPLEDRRAHQRVAKEVGAHGRVGLGELFVQDHLLHERESLAAVLHGPASADRSE